MVFAKFVLLYCFLILIQLAVGVEEEFFVFESDWHKKIEAPILSSAE